MIGLDSNIDWCALTREQRVLDTGVKYSEVGEAWQFSIDTAIASYPRIYLQLPRGHDKTDRFAWWSMLWMMSCQAKRGYAVGVDRDNARLFRDSSKKLKAMHPELFEEIEIEKHVVYSKTTGSHIETISSDANSAYGLNFDLLIINDFHAWPDEEFWQVLWTACEKKPDIRVWIESNALTLGKEGTIWINKIRKDVKDILSKRINTNQDKPEWWYFCPDHWLAGWTPQQKIDDWQRTLHPSAFKRLIENRDTSDADSFVTIEQVEAIEAEKASSHCRVVEKGRVVTAVDLGLTKDSTAICSVQAIPRGKGNAPKLVLLNLDVLTGSPEDPVLIEEVEKIALAHKNQFNSYPILCDPWQMKSSIQRFPGIFEEWTFGGKRVADLTSILYRVIADRHLSIYPNAGKMIQDGEEWDLKRELVSAVVKLMSYGQRIDHRNDGYTDRIMALGMCCYYLLDGGIPMAPPIKDFHPKRDDWEGEKIIKGWITESTARKSDTVSLMGLLNL